MTETVNDPAAGSFNLTMLERGTTYSVRVAGMNVRGLGDWTDKMTVMTPVDRKWWRHIFTCTSKHLSIYGNLMYHLWLELTVLRNLLSVCIHAELSHLIGRLRWQSSPPRHPVNHWHYEKLAVGVVQWYSPDLDHSWQLPTLFTSSIFASKHPNLFSVVLDGHVGYFPISCGTQLFTNHMCQLHQGLCHASVLLPGVQSEPTLVNTEECRASHCSPKWALPPPASHPTHPHTLSFLHSIKHAKSLSLTH